MVRGLRLDLEKVGVGSSSDFHHQAAPWAGGLVEFGELQDFLKIPLVFGTCLSCLLGLFDLFLSDQNSFSPRDFHREARQELNDERGRALGEVLRDGKTSCLHTTQAGSFEHQE